VRSIGNFAHLMSSTVQVAARTGVDGYDKPTYGTPVAYRCHIAKGARLMPEMAGQQVSDAIQIYLNSADAILPTSQVTLSTSDVGSTESFDRQPRLLAVERRFDQHGAHHATLYCGWAPKSV